MKSHTYLICIQCDIRFVMIHVTNAGNYSLIFFRIKLFVANSALLINCVIRVVRSI